MPPAALCTDIVAEPAPIAVDAPECPAPNRDPVTTSPSFRDFVANARTPYRCRDDGPARAWDERAVGVHVDASVSVDERAQIRAALDTWAAHTPVEFIDVAEPRVAGTIDVSVGHDGCTESFEAADLAHAFKPFADEPLAGDLHFNETWAPYVDLYTVALHESGHSLGLTHSDNPDAVMYPFYRGPVEGLHADDVAAIQSLYPGGPAVEAERFYNINGGVVGTCSASATPPGACGWALLALVAYLIGITGSSSGRSMHQK